AARNAGVRVLLNFVDILSPNETELARLTGLPTESFEEITQAALKCHEMGAKQVLVKLGHKGSAQKPIQQPAILSKTVVDTTDAGDTFTAAFTVALVEGKSKKECLGFVIVECNSFFLFGKTCLTIMFCNSCCSLSLCSSEGSLSLHA
ncbi:Ribokinase, partial [Glycine soja]